MLDTRDEKKIARTKMVDNLLLIPLDDKFPEGMIRISSKLSNEEFAELEGALKQNADIFAWSANDMPRVSLEVITHKLNVDLTYHHVKQKRRNITSDRS